MKKYFLILLALAVALSFGAPAMAKDGLSADLGFAYNANGAGMAKTIVKDGEEGQGNGLFGDVLLGENSMLAIKKNKSALGPLISKVNTDSSMSGLSTTLRARYDFLNSFFVRLGFTYDKQIGGGNDSFTIANNVGTPGVDGISTYLILKQGVAAGAASAWATALAGKKVTQQWTYASWAIPATVGINVPIADGKYNVYAGIGLTYISGYWQIEAKMPQGYIVADYNNSGAIDATDLAAAVAGKESLKFESSGFGINYTLGATAQVVDQVSLFIELDSTVAGGMSDSVKLKTNQGKAAFGLDNVYYPIDLSSTLIRFGVSYYIMAL